jgi:hypothetical protein
VSVVIFDSQAPINTGQGVYMSALAEELTDAELDRGIARDERVPVIVDAISQRRSAD